MFRELLAKPGNVFMGGRPVRVASIAVENQRAGLQRFFKAFLTERNCLAVIVRTYDFKIHAVAHEPPASVWRIAGQFIENPAARAIRHCARRVKPPCGKR
jgi:hypothetical protein